MEGRERMKGFSFPRREFSAFADATSVGQNGAGEFIQRWMHEREFSTRMDGMDLIDLMGGERLAGMAIARRDVGDVSEAVIMAAVMEDLGGSVFSVCQDQEGRWHVWARFRSGNRTEKIDADFQETLKRLERDAVSVLSETAAYIKPGRSKRRGGR